MTLRKMATSALLAGALAGASLAAGAQPNSVQVAWAAADEIDVQFTRAHSMEDLKRLCGAAMAESGSRTCSFARPSAGHAATCVIVSLEPESFNDVPRLVAFGREILNCMSASAPPMAAAAKR